MKHINRFNEGIVEWKEEDFQECIDKLLHYVEHAEELTGEKDLSPEEAVMMLDDIGTDYALDLSRNIDGLLDLIAEFDVESEEEKSRLN